jgi:apolipoprotein N-acyltransferase
MREAIAAIEPGFHPVRELWAVPREQVADRMAELFRQRLLEPSRAELLREPATDLVLWPESSVPRDVPLADIEAGRARLVANMLPATSCRLLLGGGVSSGRRSTPAALLLSLPDGRVLAHQEKRLLVPGGEFPPFLAWLPAGFGSWVVGVFEQALGALPNATPGRELPPLRTAAGVPFGMLMCYDNAFLGPAAAQVGAGARFLCVLSNESWFECGGELEQLLAATVVRCLECATPVVRCTQDGYTAAFGADGIQQSALPPLPSPQPAARILRVELEPGAGRLPPMASLRAAAGPSSAGLGALVLLHGLWRWARLRSARTASRAVVGPGSPGDAHGTGS